MDRLGKGSESSKSMAQDGPVQSKLDAAVMREQAIITQGVAMMDQRKSTMQPALETTGEPGISRMRDLGLERYDLSNFMMSGSREFPNTRQNPFSAHGMFLDPPEARPPGPSSLRKVTVLQPDAHSQLAGNIYGIGTRSRTWAINPPSKHTRAGNASTTNRPRKTIMKYTAKSGGLSEESRKEVKADITHSRYPICEVQNGLISVKTVNNSRLDITPNRIRRVPDNHPMNPPPVLGSFPVYSIDEYKEKLPESLVKKGGVFIPIHQREALCLSFNSTVPFAIKVYAGGVNVISGRSKNPAFQNRGKDIAEGPTKAIQDYIVTPTQRHIDGMVSSDGRKKQFVATPIGSGYSIEAQLTNLDSIAGLQIEVIPVKREYSNPEGKAPLPIPTMQIFVKMLHSSTISLMVAEEYTIDQVKYFIHKRVGIPVEQIRLICNGRELIGHHKIAQTSIEAGTTLQLALRLLGGAIGEMALAAGGEMTQVIYRDPHPPYIWDHEASIMFNIQMIDATLFPSMIGLPLTSEPLHCAIPQQRGRLPGELPIHSLHFMGRKLHTDTVPLGEHDKEKDLGFGSVGV